MKYASLTAASLVAAAVCFCPTAAATPQQDRELLSRLSAAGLRILDPVGVINAADYVCKALYKGRDEDSIVREVWMVNDTLSLSESRTAVGIFTDVYCPRFGHIGSVQA